MSAGAGPGLGCVGVQLGRDWCAQMMSEWESYFVLEVQFGD